MGICTSTKLEVVLPEISFFIIRSKKGNLNICIQRCSDMLVGEIDKFLFGGGFILGLLVSEVEVMSSHKTDLIEGILLILLCLIWPSLLKSCT